MVNEVESMPDNAKVRTLFIKTRPWMLSCIGTRSENSETYMLHMLPATEFTTRG